MTRSERYLIRGRVQGVAYRYSARQKATALGLTGWVRNLPDGCVEAVASGTPDALDAFHAWLLDGPATARVTAVERYEAIEGETVAGFEIRR